jgi:hypothetical protein
MDKSMMNLTAKERQRERRIREKLRAEDGIQNLEQFRNSMGLEPVARRERACLKCSKMFLSIDIKRIRLCEKCREQDPILEINMSV